MRSSFDAGPLREARDDQIHARVLVHAFAGEPFLAMVGQGLKAAERAEEVASDALRELRVRRTGLLVAALLDTGLLLTRRVEIRSLPSPSADSH